MTCCLCGADDKGVSVRDGFADIANEHFHDICHPCHGRWIAHPEAIGGEFTYLEAQRFHEGMPVCRSAGHGYYE